MKNNWKTTHLRRLFFVTPDEVRAFRSVLAAVP